MQLFRDLGIDLGTANVMIFADGEGIVLREPAVVAVNKNDGQVLCVGTQARNMMGRTPGNVEAVRPMQGGAVTDYDMTERLLAGLIRKVVGYTLVKPRAVISVPTGITEVEERAVIQAALEAGARRAYLIERPLAAALGAQLDVTAVSGKMVIDFGGGITDCAVVASGGVASSRTIRVGGDTFDEAIVAYVRKHYEILISSATAEEIKIGIGGVMERPVELSMPCKGRDLKTGLPREVTLTSTELYGIFRRGANQIVEEILAVLEQTAPDLVADLATSGIVLTGGGCQLWGMAELIHQRTELPCRIADDPDSCAVLGCGRALRWLDSMKEGPLNLSRRKIMQEI
ncbi:MAG: rod shape-determining protein [Oscillospiraceae bacterium]|nr:rod shape-determining protein [Oscillospiraceae bacterium]